jgi:aminocarboxymuconate-semialdehyde decarboxylase
MTTRRHFLKIAAGAAGVAFCSCAMLDGARAQQASGQRLPVTVNGKRVKTIDVHAHCLFHEAEKLMGSDNAAFTATVKGAPQAFRSRYSGNHPQPRPLWTNLLRWPNSLSTEELPR